MLLMPITICFSNSGKRLHLFTVVVLSIATISFNVSAQCDIQFKEKENSFILRNNLIERVLMADLQNHGFYTVSFKNLQTGTDQCLPGTKEFSFKIDGHPVTGGKQNRSMDYQSHRIIANQNGSKTLSILLKGRRGTSADGVSVNLFYEIYPDMPVVRKWLSVQNKLSTKMVITDLDWEDINYEIAPPGWIPNICTFADVYAQYGQSVHKPPYTGRTDDAAILVYDYEKRQGMILGNEAPAIMKRISIYPDSTRLTIGMGYKNEDFPFKKFLEPGEAFTSPKGFLILVAPDIWQDAFENELADFVRKYMGVKLFEREKPPMFLYNTWNPFRFDIDQKVILKLSDVAARCGVDYFIIDDGWNRYYGDWDVDESKFPGGLKPVCDSIISRGMKPGLWISLAHVHKESRVCQQHPEWLVRGENGEPANLHASVPSDCYTMCFASPWYDYIKQKIEYYVETCRLGYVKLDLASVYSSYKLNSREAGCYASNHTHTDRDESLFILYSKVNQLFDELKQKFPDLYIDCTFEQYGEIYGIDYSLIKHADGDWLSNIEMEPPYGALYLRQLAYERARVVPSSTMLIGNMQMNWDNSELCFQSLMSATCMMLGDLRELSDSRIAWYRKWSDWAKEMQDKYKYTHYYQVSDVFSRPEINGWDGCARINPARGGLLMFYRNNSPEKERVFPIVWVDPFARYRIYSPLSENLIGEFSGEELRTSGLHVLIPDPNSAKILEIKKVTE